MRGDRKRAALLTTHLTTLLTTNDEHGPRSAFGAVARVESLAQASLDRARIVAANLEQAKRRGGGQGVALPRGEHAPKERKLRRFARDVERVDRRKRPNFGERHAARRVAGDRGAKQLREALGHRRSTERAGRNDACGAVRLPQSAGLELRALGGVKRGACAILSRTQRVAQLDGEVDRARLAGHEHRAERIERLAPRRLGSARRQHLRRLRAKEAREIGARAARVDEGALALERAAAFDAAHDVERLLDRGGRADQREFARRGVEFEHELRVGRGELLAQLGDGAGRVACRKADEPRASGVRRGGFGRREHRAPQRDFGRVSGEDDAARIGRDDRAHLAARALGKQRACGRQRGLRRRVRKPRDRELAAGCGGRLRGLRRVGGDGGVRVDGGVDGGEGLEREVETRAFTAQKQPRADGVGSEREARDRSIGRKELEKCGACVGEGRAGRRERRGVASDVDAVERVDDRLDAVEFGARSRRDVERRGLPLDDLEDDARQHRAQRRSDRGRIARDDGDGAGLADRRRGGRTVRRGFGRGWRWWRGLGRSLPERARRKHNHRGEPSGGVVQQLGVRARGHPCPIANPESNPLIPIPRLQPPIPIPDSSVGPCLCWARSKFPILLRSRVRPRRRSDACGSDISAQARARRDRPASRSHTEIDGAP